MTEKDKQTGRVNIEKIAEHFDSYGERWITAYSQDQEKWYEYKNAKLREKYACELIANEPKGMAVDLGCGAGSALIRMKRMGFNQVIGVDISENMLSAARTRIAENNLSESIKLLKCDVRHLETIESNRVDCCIALGLIEYLEDVLLLSEVNRILKINGVAVIQARNYHCLYTRTIQFIISILPKFILSILRNHHARKSEISSREHSPKELRKTLPNFGFSIEKECYSHFYALYPFTLIPIISTIIKPLDRYLSKKWERLSSNPISIYLASMYIFRIRKVANL